MTAFYNEIDPFAAQMLRNLIAAGLIAPGVVDERSIEDIKPEELYGYTQCHFFAGVGVWSLALRNAGWPDSRPIWTGSCPCQPFSSAGAGAGFADERHLWPAFHHLIAECKPPKVLGEQVASSHVDPWIDLVQADLEALGYAFGGVPFPSAGVGAPHIRDRLYWVADAADFGRDGRRPGVEGNGRDAAWFEPERLRHAGRLVHAHDARLEGLRRGHQAESGRIATIRPVATTGEFGGVADHHGLGREVALQHDGSGRTSDGLGQAGIAGVRGAVDGREPGPTNGFWRDADWLGCRDGKWRPVEPGTFPLAHGAPARVGRLRAYGNAINAEAARIFIEAVMGSV